jgi:hypothetical protein
VEISGLHNPQAHFSGVGGSARYQNDTDQPRMAQPTGDTCQTTHFHPFLLFKANAHNKTGL